MNWLKGAGQSGTLRKPVQRLFMLFVIGILLEVRVRSQGALRNRIDSDTLALGLM